MENKDHFDIVDFIESTIEPKENVIASEKDIDEWLLEEEIKRDGGSDSINKLYS